MRPDSAGRRARIIHLTQAGYSAPEIADLLNLSQRTIHRHRVAAGIGGPAPVPLTAAQCALGDQLVADGVHVTEVARSVGCSHTTVSRRWPHVTRLGPADGARISALFRVLEVAS